MSSVAYLDVTFSKTITLKEGTVNDLKKRFSITVKDQQVGEPESAIDSNNKVRLGIKNTDVPQPGDEIKITYTGGALGDLTENQGALVDSSTGYLISNLVTVGTHQISQFAPNIRPTITSAVVEHEDPTTIVIKFTPGRDVSSNSIKGDDTTLESQTGAAGYGITPTFELGSEGAHSNPTWIDGSNNTAFEEETFATLKLKTGSGQIQNGMKITLDISGFNIVDQFDLSMNENDKMTTLEASQFINNVKKVVLADAYIANNDPSACIMYFKTENYNKLDMKKITVGYDECKGKYKIEMDSEAVDVSGVRDVLFSSVQCSNKGIDKKYADVSGIMFELKEYPFKYNTNVKVFWETSGITDVPKKLADEFGNELFNSEYDTNAIDTGYIPITSNLIKGIKINPEALDVSSGVIDLSYNVILNFQPNGSNEDITGVLVENIPTDFSFNVTRSDGKVIDSFNPDIVRQLDEYRIQLCVNYNEETFDKMITQDDVVKLSYTNTSWPSSIKDEYGNFMIPQNNLSVTNSLDGRGNVRVDGVGLRKTETDYDEIDISYNVDICLNYIDASNYIYNPDLSGGFTISVSDPTGVEITQIIAGVNNNKAIIKLNKGLYATSLPTLTYSNTNSVIRNRLGPKLKNETLTTNLIDSLSAIEAPRQEFIFNTGKINELGIIDISFSEPIVGLGNGEGFKYAVGYDTTMGDLSTNSFIDVPTSGVSLNDSFGIRLNTGYNQSVGVRGFSKKTTGDGGQYHITIKYTGPDISDNRPSGGTGYLPDFGEISMADTSNNIFDPSCNLFPDDNTPTAIVTHEYPNVVYIAMQQPAYNGADVTFYDISQINIFPNNDSPKFKCEFDVTGVTETTNISTETGLELHGHNASTKWIKATFSVDLSTNDLSLNYLTSDGIRDQNGGILQAFEHMDICSNVLWCDVTDDTNPSSCKFEEGYPYIGEDGKTVYCRWDPDFSDFEGTSYPNYKIITHHGNIEINCIAQESEQDTTGADTENILKLTFENQLNNDDTLIYTKPLGRAGIRLGDKYKWVKSFQRPLILGAGLLEVGVVEVAHG